MIRLKIFLRVLFGLPKTLYINLVALPFNLAIRLPIIVSWNTTLSGIRRGSIRFKSQHVSTGLIKIGIIDGSAGINSYHHNYIGCDKGSIICFGGSMTMAQGGTLKVVGGGILEIGKNVSFNYDCKVLSKNKISIDNNVLFGWNVVLNDGDGHIIYDDDNVIINAARSIVINDSVWIGANATLLKGSLIGEGSIVGYGSIVTKKFPEKRVIITGLPAKIVKKDIRWSI